MQNLWQLRINYLCNIVKWLGLEFKYLWFALMVAVAVYWVWRYLIADTLGLALLGTGFTLQIWGLLIVAKGLHENQRLFRRPWIKPPPPFLPHTHYLEVGNSVQQNYSSTGRIEVGTDPMATHEVRLSQLEASLRVNRQAIYDAEMNLRAEIHALTETLVAGKANCVEGIERVERQLEKAVIGDIRLEAVGVFWLALGLVLSSL